MEIFGVIEIYFFYLTVSFLCCFDFLYRKFGIFWNPASNDMVRLICRDVKGVNLPKFKFQKILNDKQKIISEECDIF